MYLKGFCMKIVVKTFMSSNVNFLYFCKFDHVVLFIYSIYVEVFLKCPTVIFALGAKMNKKFLYHLDF
jgi:hypothetical protein